MNYVPARGAEMFLRRYRAGLVALGRSVHAGPPYVCCSGLVMVAGPGTIPFLDTNSRFLSLSLPFLLFLSLPFCFLPSSLFFSFLLTLSIVFSLLPLVSFSFSLLSLVSFRFFHYFSLSLSDFCSLFFTRFLTFAHTCAFLLPLFSPISFLSQSCSFFLSPRNKINAARP